MYLRNKGLFKNPLCNFAENANAYNPVKFQHQGPKNQGENIKNEFEKITLFVKNSHFSQKKRSKFHLIFEKFGILAFSYNPLNGTNYSSDFQHHLSIFGWIMDQKARKLAHFDPHFPYKKSKTSQLQRHISREPGIILRRGLRRWNRNEKYLHISATWKFAPKKSGDLSP